MTLGTNNIVLIGMPGCGKSSIGAIISKKLQTAFYDLDKYIETTEKMSIPEIFKLGEPHFRNIETNAVKKIYRKKSVVISTGGGIVTRQENMILLTQTGTIFYIERPITMILNSSDLSKRPLLSEDSNRIYTLHEERKHLYEAYCHFKIVNDQSLEIAADQIIKIIMGNDVVLQTEKT